VHLLTDGAKALAGGMTLLPTIKQGLAAPDALVDLSTIEALVGIREHHDKGVVIGAMTTHATVSSSDLVREKIPSLASLASGIGDAQVRHRGTIGGSLANNDPAADYPAALLGLGGSVHTNKRTIAADDFFDGLFSTALEDDEVIAHVHLPIPQYAVYVKFPQPASRYALVGVFIAQINGGVRVAVTGAGSDGVFRAQSLETALNQNFSAAALSGVQENAAELMSDLHGSAAYRAHLITILAQRALN
jgi:carbon-monoxide dehydrogenase medium subunit